MTQQASQARASATIVASRETVCNVVPPAPEGRWNPIGHNRVIEITEDAIRNAGFGVVESNFQMSNNGHRMFGSYHLDRVFGPNKGARLVVGCRNSTDKLFAMAFAAGESIMVCANGCFYGDMVVSRKHTGDCDVEFAARIKDRIKHLPQVVADATERIDFLLSQEINEAQTHHLICRGVKENVFVAAEAFKVLAEFEEPSFQDQGSGTLWGLHNAATHIFKKRADRNPIDFQERTVRLQSLLLPASLREKHSRQFELVS